MESYFGYLLLQAFTIFFGEEAGLREAGNPLRVRAVHMYQSPIRETTVQTAERKIWTLLRE